MKRKIYRYKKELLISIGVILFVFSIFLIVFAFQENIEEVKIEDKEVKEELYPYSAEEELLEIDAAAAISVFWNKEGERVLYAKNEDDSLPIASISKILTALVVWQHYNLEAPIKITETQIATVQGLENLRLWEDTKIRDALYPLLLESNNSTAVALAMQDYRFLENKFVEEMNKKVREIGLKNTFFINPSGLDEGDNWNYSTAREVYKTAVYVLENTDLFSIMNTPSYRLYSSDKMLYYTTVNTNEFLFSMNTDWKEYIVGGKTGWTYKAMGCLLLIVESPEENGYIVSVILGAENRFTEMEKLMNFIYSAYIF